MKITFFYFLISVQFLFSEEFLKVVILTKDNEFVKEFDYPNIPDISKFQIKEGIAIYYPNGRPPLVYKFKENSKELIFEEKETKKYNLIFKECEYFEKINLFLLLMPDREIKNFPLPMNYYFILLKDLSEVNLKKGLYKVEEINGKYFFPEKVDFEEKKELIFYPSFKTEILIMDDKGEKFEKCKSRIDLFIKSYGKGCKDYVENFYRDGSNYSETVPLNSKYKFTIFCEEAETFSKIFSSKEIGNPFIINLQRLGKIEGILKDEKERPISNYSLSLFYGDEAIPLKEIKTNKNGYFLFKNLREGKYFLKDTSEYQYIGDKNFDFKTDTKNLNMLIMQEKGSFRSSPPLDGTYFNEEIYLKKGEKKFLELEIPETRIWEGKVLSQDNQPLSDVYIFYKSQELGRTNLEGKFKIEFKGEKIDEIIFSKEGYSVLSLKNIDLENPPEIILLKGLGTFKVKFIIENLSFDPIPKFREDLIIIKENKEEIKTGFYFMYRENEVDFKVELEEGNYNFKIIGKNFKPYLSKPFTIYSGKEYDYGVLNLGIGGEEEKGKRQIKILVKNFKDQPSPNTFLALNIISMPNKENLMEGASTDENGFYIFSPIYENFYYNFLYAEAEDGFLFMEKEDLEPFNKLDFFEIKLNPANILRIKISNLEPKKEVYDLILKFKNGVIKDKIPYLEEKTYKNLLSPSEIEISFEGIVIWKEKIEIKEGENILFL